MSGKYLTKSEARKLAKASITDFKKTNLTYLSEEKALQKLLFIEICKKINSNDHFLGLYKNDNYEVATDELLKLLLQKKIKVALPIINSINHKLEFFQISSYEQYQKYQILAPNNQLITNNLALNKTKIKIFIIPLLAISPHHFRLGRGGGYYDQYFNNVKNKIFMSMLFTRKQIINFQKNNFDIKIKKTFYISNL